MAHLIPVIFIDDQDSENETDKCKFNEGNIDAITRKRFSQKQFYAHIRLYDLYNSFKFSIS